MTRRPHPLEKVARGYMAMVRQEPPRVKMECEICHQPAEKLNVTAIGLFVCDGCKSRIKKTGNERE